jgi:putative tryptophan/tyrosine transport system substrate-binding protein
LRCWSIEAIQCTGCYEYVPRTAQKLDMALTIVEATTAEELDIAFASAAAQHADAIVDLGDPLTYVQAPRLITLT